MPTLTTAELESMQLVFNDGTDGLMPDTCTIQTVTTSVGAMGGVTESYANTYTDVPCMLLVSERGDENVVNEALEGESTWWLTVPYDQAIDITDRVIHNSVTYEVRAVADTHSFNVMRRALLVRVN